MAAYSIDTDLRNYQVWFKLDFMPGITFGAVYIPPTDSPFFSVQSYADVQEKATEPGETVIIGDLIARIGSLVQYNNKVKGLQYTDNDDNTVNENGQKIANLSENLNLVPINHAVSCDGNYTFRHSNKWTSQID